MHKVVGGTLADGRNSPGRSNSTSRTASGCNCSICALNRKLPHRKEQTSAFSRWKTFCVVQPYSGTRSCMRTSCTCSRPAVGLKVPMHRSWQQSLTQKACCLPDTLPMRLRLSVRMLPPDHSWRIAAELDCSQDPSTCTGCVTMWC